MGFWSDFVRLLRVGRKSPLVPLVFLFAITQIAFEHSGGTNERSRMAAIFAFFERGSFRLDPDYEKFTGDWAQTPDGVYTSNKAPGPTILALPILYPFDTLLTFNTKSASDRVRLREKAGLPFAKIVSILLQVIPWALISLVLLGICIENNISLFPTLSLLVCFLFGTTTTLLLNAYWGHGVSAVFLLLFVLAIFWKEFAWAGFFFGWSLLSDYGIGLVLPGALIAVLALATSSKNIISFVKGGIIPGLIWIAYHTTYYGSPFTIPNKFQNPMFVDLADKPDAVWGIIYLVPELGRLKELLWGDSRGLLITQPWVLAVLVYLVISLFNKHLKEVKPVIAATIVGFLGIFAMNASFGGWHGGSAPGPRYLSPFLPIFALWVPFVLENSKSLTMNFFKLIFTYNFALHACIMSAAALLGGLAIWPTILHYFTHPNLSQKALIRLSVFILFSVISYISIRWQLNRRPVI